MPKIDFRKMLKALYAPSAKDFSVVDVPAMQFVMLDGRGDPNTAPAYAQGIAWLYAVSYALKFASKTQLKRDYTVPPLEALWWAKDHGKAFAENRRDDWQWTQMIMAPDWITKKMFTAARDKAAKKLGKPPATLRLEKFAEGKSVQIMHIGPYAAEAPTIARLHEEFLPANGLAENGKHHEIYLSDPRKVAPAKLKTVIRQPVRRRK